MANKQVGNSRPSLIESRLQVEVGGVDEGAAEDFIRTATREMVVPQTRAEQ